MEKYRFRRYDPIYKTFFRIEKKKLIASLGLGVEIEHVGSTAVSGLGGKGILDIAIGTGDSGIDATKDRLRGLGYEFRREASTEKRLFFRRDYEYKRDVRRVHVHLTRLNGNDWKEMVSFRDYLLENKEAAAEYSRVKRNAVKVAKGDGKTYRKEKEEFIRKFMDRK
ncbi:MAG: GrpB family protein [Thaumarchaeota archaeon]|nr:GrpB family protein [Nitrososphaerota archaeon]